MAKRRTPSMGGMGGGNMQQMLKQAQKMQEDMAKAQEEAETLEVEATAGGGMVAVKVNGKKEIVEIVIQPEVVDPDDIEMLQDLVTAAVNEAMVKIEEATKDAMGKVTGGMNIPGLM